ncbi:DegT/DnrJ/EryC1/StrS family aminotransferase [Streptosporangium sandarakinum]|uniref:DegT/DnrJ/EryC1/StrS family aminotransferase n=1 Tax=Streptosporangium sandarakinum TaxID=1260955 RepID=UPI0033BD42A1
MIPLFRTAVAPGTAERVTAVVDSGRFGHGPAVEEFERAVGDRVGNPRVAAVNNGTSGLHLALRLAGAYAGAPGAPDGPGEVLSTPFTFEATNWSILANGMRLTWVDVDPETLNIDLDDLAKKITPATRAIMVVHWAGFPVDLVRLARILDDAEAEHGFRPVVVEDCAQAWGATCAGRPLGGHGNLCVFSFHATKHLSCGGGGLLTLPDEESLLRARRLRFFGIDRDADRVNADYDVAEWGYNFYMNEINAAIGLANLETVDERVRLHRLNAAFYDAELAGVAGLELTARTEGLEPSFWLYPVKVDDRASFMRKMAGAGVTVSVVCRRNDEHGCVADARTPLPGVDAVHDRVVNIPVGWWLTPEERSHIAETIKSGW